MAPKLAEKQNLVFLIIHCLYLQLYYIFYNKIIEDAAVWKQSTHLLSYPFQSGSYFGSRAVYSLFTRITLD